MKRPDTDSLRQGMRNPRIEYNSIILEIQLTSRLSRCNITNMKLDDAAAHLEALGNPTRLKIYRALVRAGEAGMPVGELQDKLKIAPSTLSHHIKSLVTVGLIEQIREVNHARLPCELLTMRELVDFLVAECCADEAGCKETKNGRVTSADRKFRISSFMGE